MHTPDMEHLSAEALEDLYGFWRMRARAFRRAGAFGLEKYSLSQVGIIVAELNGREMRAHELRARANARQLSLVDAIRDADAAASDDDPAPWEPSA